MEIIIVATNSAIKSIDLRAAAFLDAENDVLRLSNASAKVMPISFWLNPDDLTFEGKPFESLGLSPFTLAKLKVSEQNISVEKLVFNPEPAQYTIKKVTDEIDRIKAKGATQPKGLWKPQQLKINTLEAQVVALQALLANPVTSLTPIPLVRAGQMQESAFWGLSVPYVKNETAFDVLGERKILEQDTLKLNSL